MSWIQLIFWAIKRAEFSNKINLNQLIFVVGKSTELARFRGRKINWIQLVLLHTKLAYFRSFSWQKNQLNSGRFLDWKISLLQLNFEAEKSTEFRSFYCWGNRLNAACFFNGKSAYFSSFLGQENQLNSALFIAEEIN